MIRRKREQEREREREKERERVFFNDKMIFTPPFSLLPRFFVSFFVFFVAKRERDELESECSKKEEESLLLKKKKKQSLYAV